jgi:hypothetical protein
MLRRELLVEVEHDHIVVRVTGTSDAISYYRIASSTGLVARNLPARDDHRAPMSRLATGRPYDLPYSVELWDDEDRHVEELIALTGDYRVARLRSRRPSSDGQGG